MWKISLSKLKLIGLMDAMGEDVCLIEWPDRLGRLLPDDAGYNALARLAGPEPAAFACLSNELVIRGFSAPKIIAADLDLGLLLLEDFGQTVYAKVIEASPEMEAPLYAAAVECLAEIYRSSFPAQMHYRNASWRVRSYDEAALLTETHLFLDWYAADKGADISAPARADWDDIWKQLFSALGARNSWSKRSSQMRRRSAAPMRFWARKEMRKFLGYLYALRNGTGSRLIGI